MIAVSLNRYIVTERVTTRSEIVGVISFLREKFVQNMVRSVEYVREKVVSIVIHISSSQLRQCGGRRLGTSRAG